MSGVAPMVRKTKLELAADLVRPTLAAGEHPRKLIDHRTGLGFEPTRFELSCWPTTTPGSTARARVRFTAPGYRLGRPNIPCSAVFRIFGYPHDEPAPLWVRQLVDEVALSAGWGPPRWDTSLAVPRGSVALAAVPEVES